MGGYRQTTTTTTTTTTENAKVEASLNLRLAESGAKKKKDDRTGTVIGIGRRCDAKK